MKGRAELFDGWADGYDRTVTGNESFPFDGYERVLAEVGRLVEARPGMRVLDLGTGTGNLAALLAAQGLVVWGLDLSQKMLAVARAKVPEAVFVQADILGTWPEGLPQRFDRIVSTYLFHEFDLVTKVDVLCRLAREHLAQGGRIVIGDIVFPSFRARDVAKERWHELWDEEEHYWVAEEMVPALERAGFRVSYRQVSSCGGVFVLKPLFP